MVQQDDVSPPRSIPGDNHWTDTPVTLGDTYSTILKFASLGLHSIIAIKNTHATNDLTYQILGSIKDGNTVPADNDTSWVTLKSGTDILHLADTFQTYAMTWSFILIQAKNKVGGSNATILVWNKSV